MKFRLIVSNVDITFITKYFAGDYVIQVFMMADGWKFGCC
jgi:hypothetical protein